jgi:hypothetical protein
MREEGALLRNIADAALARWPVYRSDARKERGAVDLNFSCGDVSQAGDGVEQSCLAGTRWTEDRGYPRIERDIDVQLKMGQRYAAAE